MAGAVAALTAVVVLAGCGSNDDPAPPTITADQAPGALATPAVVPATVPVKDQCTGEELSLNLGRIDGSAGSVTLPLVFTNTGARPCVLHAYPSVSYVTTEAGTEIGAAATPTRSTGSAAEPFTLAPGGRATATVRAVQVENYPEHECGPTPVAGLRVHAPGDSAAKFVAYAGTGCVLPGVDQLQVTAFAPL
ncbi:DUF4232 domain-containing protein [Rhodococcus gannanensis]|uniref:DUF4232 domain-containing protein n=1 Tax=Rhodococcus gannanensis TaxID=1960308 RepID=A0ABW4P153_9NOCA